ncbi:DUF4393 domain-containing protein [Helicovermis profundi]|uniref:DUF4393 domain-containing protein n=1 Tax=Helicovermis profundi TaxID=3065157 RepID=A0AAU9E3K8_9FIRM|nr:hypothetical protein HLPR_01540 [Clostridia bacterium S502]
MNTIITKKAIDESVKLLPQVYEDIAQPAFKEVGTVVGKSVKSLLAPVRGLLWGWEKIEEFIVNDVEKKLEKISLENRKSPDPEIAVPAMQALTYTADNKYLREMFVNLLANSMDLSKNKLVHPSFTEIIKQMSSLDAKVLERISKNKGNIRATNPEIRIVGSNQVFIDATPNWFLGWTFEGFDIFDISASLVRLSKYGLIELMFDRTAGKDGYEQFTANHLILDILDKYQTENLDRELEIYETKSVFYINDYGKQFVKVCL